MRCGLWIELFMCACAAFSGLAVAASSESDPTMNKRTRQYVSTAQACVLAVGLLQLEIKRGKSSLVELADTTTQARDICNGVRSRLLGINTDHFDDQATEVWYGIDRFKSGLNALLTYLDTNAPSKLIEARDKLQEGDATFSIGFKHINQRRRIYGLAPLKL